MKTNLLRLMAAAFACCFISAHADQSESPLWLRNTAISPSGDVIAFTYHGDIFTVPFGGGKATQITSNSAYDTAPVWSPDGTKIAFASTRMGSYDIFIVDAAGGTPKRLTTNSAGERPIAFINDTTILYSSNVMPAQTAAQPGIQAQVYTVSTNGGRPKLYASVPMGAASADKQGRILYQDKKGYEDPLRKHERSSGTSDIWLLDGGKYTKLTTFNGHDLAPVWAADDAFYYISEQDGTLNVWKRTLAGTDTQLTKFERHPVRTLSASADGNKLAFSWNGELYTLQPGQEPKKVDVTIIADDYDADLAKGYRSSGATAMAVSPSGEEVAFVLRGDVYVTSVKYETTRRITETDGQERVIAFSPDGKKLVYDSERNGLWQIFMSTIKDDEENFTYAKDVKEELLYKGDKAAQQPVFSPDGKKVAFLEDRTTLQVIDLDTKKVTTALDGKYNYSYSDGDVPFSWSPDSRWLLITYIGVGGWNNVDAAAVKADGSEVVDLTESGYSDSAPKWALGGKAITYTSGRNGYRSHGSWGEEEDVYLMVLDPEAWDEFNLSEEDAALLEKSKDKEKEKADDKKDTKDKKDKKGKKDEKADKDEPLQFDFANRHYRTARLTGTSSMLADYYLTKKGDKLYYVCRNTDGKINLMVRDIKKGSTKVLVPSIGSAELIPSKDDDALFVLTSTGMQKIDIPGGDSEEIEFSAPFSRHPSAERAYIFDHAVSQVADKFYDANIHGVDWKGYAEDYRKFLPYINNNYDFAELLSELLGELNASHTGARYYASGAKLPVASLGAFFDDNYEGEGLKVVEVLNRGPLAKKSVGIAADDVILSIDGVEIGAGTDYYPLLEGKADKKVRLGVMKPSSEVVYVDVKPTDDVSDLLYQRWVEHNEHIVDSISGGKIGYVHIEGMDSPSFRMVYSKLLGKYRNCDAVVVDTRYNGGGWLHNDIALLLSGTEYVRYSPRGQFIGHDPFSQWTKPSVMLISECNYSDAHATPYVYKALGIGKLVGAPVPGTMTAVWWENQIDPTMLFGIPEVTSLDQNGKPLENQQLNPDIEVYNNPADVLLGTDAQLIEAVKSLMK